MMDQTDLKGLSDMVGPLTPPTLTEIASARSFVKSHALDADDCTNLLCALGLEDVS